MEAINTKVPCGGFECYVIFDYDEDNQRYFCNKTFDEVLQMARNSSLRGFYDTVNEWLCSCCNILVDDEFIKFTWIETDDDNPNLINSSIKFYWHRGEYPERYEL